MDMTNWWSWVSFVNGGFALWLAFRFPRVGPFYNIVGQAGWFAYGLNTHQYGFLFSSVMYAGIFLWASRRAFRAKKADEALKQDQI